MLPEEYKKIILENNIVTSDKVKNILSYNSAFLMLRVYPIEMKSYANIKAFTRMFLSQFIHNFQKAEDNQKMHHQVQINKFYIFIQWTTLYNKKDKLLIHAISCINPKALSCIKEVISRRIHILFIERVHILFI